MTGLFLLASIGLLATTGLALVRVVRGPGRVDRMMAVQLVGSNVIAVAVTLSVAQADAAMLDVALVGAVLAAVVAAAFASVRGASGSDPSSDEWT